MNKRQLRLTYNQKRQELTEERYCELNDKIKALFFQQFNLFSGKTVHSFLPVKRRKEVDTWPIISELSKVGATVTVPRAHIDVLQLTSHLYHDQILLEENEWGVPEPTDNDTVPADAIDLALLPLLSFDERGYRVGYGKGFYDRFLCQCRPDILKIGLSFFPPVRQIIDVDEFDVRMNFCITPNKVYSF